MIAGGEDAAAGRESASGPELATIAGVLGPAQAADEQTATDTHVYKHFDMTDDRRILTQPLA